MVVSISYLIGGLLLGYVFNKILIILAQKIGGLYKGNTSQIRWAKRTKPVVGGLSFFAVFLLASLTAFFFSPTSGNELWPLFISGSMGIAIGFIDDVYNTRALLKFCGQLACALVLILCGVYIHASVHVWVNYLLTIFWVVAIMNSFNMLDNMDGVSGSVATGVLLSCLAVMVITGQQNNIYFLLTLALIGAHISFLYLNWNPSKLYMGDAGSQFLGLVLAFYGIHYLWNGPTLHGDLVLSRQFLVTVTVFAMTILDTSFVTLARLSRGQSPFVGGKDHITHHLVYFGIKERYVALVTGGVSFVSGGLAIYLAYYTTSWRMVDDFILLGYLGCLALAFAVLYRIGAARLKRALNPAPKVVAPAITPRPLPRTVPAPQLVHGS